MSRRKTHYAEGWKEFARFIREERAGGRCECMGECGLHPPVLYGPGPVASMKGADPDTRIPVPRRCIEQDGEPARYMKRGTIVMLTVAHLNADGGPCRCNPRCIDPTHVKAMCQRCHLRYDGPRHTRNARESRLIPAGEQQPLLPSGAGEHGDSPRS